MTLKNKYERFEDFKADIWKWKSENREEYNRFAQNMGICDERGFFLFYRAVAAQMPQLVRQWELVCNDDTCPDKFAEIDVLFKEQNIPQQIVEQYGQERISFSNDKVSPSLWRRIKMFFGWRPQPSIRISAPLVLSWLFFGRSFEAMVLMLEKQAKRPKTGMLDVQTCGHISKLVIQTSIKGRYRTWEGWERFFAEQNAAQSGNLGEWALQSVVDEMKVDVNDNTRSADSTAVSINVASRTQRTAGKKKIQERPLADYLDCKNKTEVLQYLRSFVSINTSAVHQALPYYVLKELRLVAGMHTVKEYSVGLTLQFPDLPSLKSESAIRQAVGFLKTAKHVIKDGKDQMAPLIESDENQGLFQTLVQAISSIMDSDNTTSSIK